MIMPTAQCATDSSNPDNPVRSENGIGARLLVIGSDPVASYYELKTESILRRYGPGPRVHFHTGFLKQAVPLGSAAQVRALLRASQKKMLLHAAEIWNVRASAPEHVLDVGCGLGGTAIFFAEKLGLEVTAITNVPSHVDLVQRFSTQAGVSSKVHVLLCDALKFPGENRFDVIVAIESSCHLSRPLWFRRAAKLLRPGGRLLVADCFLDKEAYREPFDRHWCARIGTVEEYLSVARQAGLTLDRFDDFSELAANFWATTTTLIRLETMNSDAGRNEIAKAHESVHVHSLMRDGLLDGGYRHMLLSFLKPTSISKPS